MHTETLPPDWRMVTFGEMAFHIADRVDDPKSAGVEIYVGLEHIDPGSLRIKRWGTPDDVGATKLRVKPGQIIFGKRRAYQRKVAVSHFDGICSAHAMVLEANIETTAPGFLGFFMQSDLFFDTALAISEGSLSPTIKWKTLAAQQFPLPPRARQQEMVELFQALEEAIAATEESLAAAEELKRALLRELLTRGIGHSEFKETEIGPVPVAWEVVSIANLGNSDEPVVLTSPFGSHLRPDEFTDSGVPVLNIGNIQYGYMTLDKLDYVRPEKAEELKRYKLQPGDLLFSRMATVGRTAEVPENCTDWLLSYHLMRLRLDSKKAIPKFIMCQLIGSDAVKTQIEQASFGTTRTGINTTLLSNILVSLPSIDEQWQITETILTVDEQLETLRAHKTHLESLKAQAINRLLTGQHDAARAGVEAATV
jgi:type I restriction enzyme S subunit